MKSMRGLCLYILLLISSMASAARKDSIYQSVCKKFIYTIRCEKCARNGHGL